MSNKRRFTLGFLSTLGTQLVSWVLSFLVARYMPQYLHGVGLAKISVANAFVTACSILVAMGTGEVLIKEVARNHARTGDYLLSGILLRLLAGIPLILGGVFLSRLLYREEDQRFLVLFAMISLLVITINELLRSVLIGLEEFPKSNISVFLERVIFSSVIVALVVLKAPLWAFIVYPSVGILISFSLNAFNVGKILRASQIRLTMPRWETMRTLATMGVPFLVGTLLFVIWEPGNKILLSKIAGHDPTSWYELTKRLAGTAMFIPSALVNTVFPSLSRQYHEEFEEFYAYARRMFRYILICSVPFAAIFLFAPIKIITLMNYPPEYMGSLPVLQLMGAGIVIWFLSQVAAYTLVACDRQAVFSKITLTAAVVCLPVCALCIWLTHHVLPLHNGALGAMLADILIEVFMLSAYVRHLPRGLFDQRDWFAFARAMVAAAPLVLSLYQMRTFADFYFVIPGLAAFPVLCVVLRCLDTRDVDSLKGMFTRKFSRAAA